MTHFSGNAVCLGCTFNFRWQLLITDSYTLSKSRLPLFKNQPFISFINYSFAIVKVILSEIQKWRCILQNKTLMHVGWWIRCHASRQILASPNSTFTITFETWHWHKLLMVVLQYFNCQIALWMAIIPTSRTKI